MPSSTVSRLAEIIDTASAIAGGISGVKSVWGAGSGLVADPLRANQTVAPLLSNVPAPYSHVTFPPSAAVFDWGPIGTSTVRWTIPMRLYFDANDVQRLVQNSTPFYAAYITAFAANLTLRGTCREAYLTNGLTAQSGPGEDAWKALVWTLTVTERLTLVQTA